MKVKTTLCFPFHFHQAGTDESITYPQLVSQSGILPLMEIYQNESKLSFRFAFAPQRVV
jgi:hypothetical protein